MNRLSRRDWLLIALLLIWIPILWALGWSWRALSAFKNGQPEIAASASRRALPIVKILDVITFTKVPDLHLWARGLEVMPLAARLQTVGGSYLQALANQESVSSEIITDIKTELDTLGATFAEIYPLFTKTIFVQRLIPVPIKNVVAELGPLVPALSPLFAELSTSQHTYLILFQNSHEVRATGGFMGSYAQVTLSEGAVTELSINDIYEPDGQFTGFVEAPPGVKEYLSGGKGWRLPDANWHPDFGMSAQHILSYFALGKKQNIEGVIAVNLSLAEQILTITGPVYLPDYQLTVTAENLAEVARADRPEFFAGSYQKPQFLRALITHLRLKIQALPSDQKQALIALVMGSVETKNIQAYSSNSQIQEFFQHRGATGELMVNHHGPSFLLVESNVGINKANKKVVRDTSLSATEYRTQVTTTFKNQNSEPENAYINYQRVIVPLSYTVHTLSVNNQPITQWDEAIIKNTDGNEFKQLGFLVSVAASKTASYSLELSHPSISQEAEWLIQKQAGLPPTPYSVTFNGETQNIILDQDQRLTF
ncbi:MAG TPA: DUF4012 domain-containing protein [Vitreimonas sp.]|nr:DUF4012 domain-containing protein [Vitreimonas sp.]